jgi:hypothetical protein
MNIAQNRERSARLFADAPALLFEDRAYTYAQLEAEAGRAAHALRALGVERGNRVALFLPNVPEFAVVYLAAQKLGAGGDRGVLPRADGGVQGAPPHRAGGRHSPEPHGQDPQARAARGVIRPLAEVRFSGGAPARSSPSRHHLRATEGSAPPCEGAGP